MSEWRKLPLKEITVKIGSGSTPTGGSGAYKETGVSLIRSQNVLDFSFTNNGLAFIDEEQAHALRNVIVEPQDVLLNITGDSVARCCSAPREWLPARVNQHVAIIRAHPKHLDSLFLKYSLISIKDELLSLSEIGGTRNALTKSMLENLKLFVPSVIEQKAIASVLSSLDDKIDLLHRQNKTLESMANTLFRQWFIEDAHIHWTEKKLSSFGRIICGKTPSKKNSLYFGNDVPFLKIPDMHGKVFVFKSTDNLSFAGEHSQSKKTIPPGSICVSCIATVGLVCITDVSMQTNQQINSIIPNKEYYKYFLYLLMKSMGDELNNLASGGTATLNLNTGDFSNITFLSPSENELKIFHQSISSLFDKLKLNSKQINIIENLRDTLLPKLMSGEVRVQDAEEAIASVV